MQADSSSAKVAEAELNSSSEERAQLRLASAPAPREGLHYLGAADEALWDALVDASPQGSIFCYSWWLRALAPRIRVLGYFEKGRLVAGMPLLQKRYGGVSVCMMPKFSHFWGVIMEPGCGKRVTAASREMELLRVFAGRLKREIFFLHDFHPTLKNWLPFYWEQFSQISRCAYKIENPSSVSDRLKTGCGTIIRGANELASARSQGSSEEIRSSVIREAAAGVPIENETARTPEADEFHRVLCAARERGAAEWFTAGNGRGRALATGALVWDKRGAYYLYSCAHRRLKDSNLYLNLAERCLQAAGSRFAEIAFMLPMPDRAEQVLLEVGARQIFYNRVFKFPWWSSAVLGRFV